MHSTALALTNMYSSNLISDAMVSNSSSNTSAPTANGGNPLPGQQTSLLASVMQIPLKKGQKVKEADPATLQSGMTETGFSEGGETSVSIELQGRLALIFILSSTNSSSHLFWKDGQYGVEILQSKSLIGSHRHMNQKATFVRSV